MHRRHFCSLAAFALIPRRVLPAARRPHGPHPEPRPGITAEKVPAVADLSHKGAGRAFDQVRQIPHIVDGIRCHCGCAENPDFYSLLSCFEGQNAMAQHCAICQSQGRLAFRLSREGKSLDEIRAAIDLEYGEE
jgi:hypothetical protein